MHGHRGGGKCLGVLLEIGDFNIYIVGLQGTQAKYEELLFQFVCCLSPVTFHLLFSQGIAKCAKSPRLSQVCWLFYSECSALYIVASTSNKRK